MPETVVLVGGPQDGAKVRGVPDRVPSTIYVGPVWLGDGFSAWSRTPSDRFPANYFWNASPEDGSERRFLFGGWKTS